MRATRVRDAAGTLITAVKAVRVLRDRGVVPAARELPALLGAARRGGGAGAVDVLSARFGDRPAVIDEGVPVTYRDLADRTRRWMNVLYAAGAHERPMSVGVMCRNSSDMIVVMLGSIMAGTRLVFFNTDMGPEQARAVGEREGVEILVHDAEFSTAAAATATPRTIVTARTSASGGERFADALADAGDATPARPTQRGAVVILTSGSTGTPRGAARGGSPSTTFPTIAGLLEKIPMRADDRILLAPPAFHGWGLIATLAALGLGATLVFEGRFDAERSIASIEREDCTVMIVVPTMLKRIMALDEATVRPAVGRLRIIGSGGARLDPDLVVATGERFGHVLHNLYGATEVSCITIATPDDLASSPDCAGSPPLGVTVAVLKDGREVPAGQIGDIYVRTGAAMDSYTDGTHKESMDGMVKTGDLGAVDAAGRLFVRGRSDGMIVSGGENVYPEEVEMMLCRHPHVIDAFVYSVADDDFGQRIAAVVAADPADVDEAELKQFVATNLSRSRVPRDVRMVDVLPRTSAGKVTRETLDRLLAAPADVDRPQHATGQR